LEGEVIVSRLVFDNRAFLLSGRHVLELDAGELRLSTLSLATGIAPADGKILSATGKFPERAFVLLETDEPCVSPERNRVLTWSGKRWQTAAGQKDGWPDEKVWTFADGKRVTSPCTHCALALATSIALISKRSTRARRLRPNSKAPPRAAMNKEIRARPDFWLNVASRSLRVILS